MSRTVETQGAKAPAEPTPGLGLLWGAAAIGACIGREATATAYMLRSGHLPSAKKIGQTWTATPDGLRRDLGLQTGAADGR